MIGQKQFITISYNEILPIRGYQTHGYCIWIGSDKGFQCFISIILWRRRGILITQGMFEIYIFRIILSKLNKINSSRSTNFLSRPRDV